MMAAYRIVPARVRAFVSKHPALTLAGALAMPIVLIDQALKWHALAMVLALYALISFADAWDEETRR